VKPSIHESKERCILYLYFLFPGYILFCVSYINIRRCYATPFIKMYMSTITLVYKCLQHNRLHVVQLTLLMSKFCGLRSRCNTLWLWQNARPRRSWYIKDFTTSGSISPFRLSKYFFRSWSQCSNTRVNFLSLCKTS